MNTATSSTLREWVMTMGTDRVTASKKGRTIDARVYQQWATIDNGNSGARRTISPCSFFLLRDHGTHTCTQEGRFTQRSTGTDMHRIGTSLTERDLRCLALACFGLYFCYTTLHAHCTAPYFTVDYRVLGQRETHRYTELEPILEFTLVLVRCLF